MQIDDSKCDKCNNFKCNEAFHSDNFSEASPSSDDLSDAPPKYMNISTSVIANGDLKNKDHAKNGHRPINEQIECSQTNQNENCIRKGVWSPLGVSPLQRVSFQLVSV